MIFSLEININPGDDNTIVADKVRQAIMLANAGETGTVKNSEGGLVGEWEAYDIEEQDGEEDWEVVSTRDMLTAAPPPIPAT